MTALVKVHRKGQLTLPTKLRRLAGIDEGDLVQASFQRGRIVITPTLIIDRTKLQTADDECTPAQRRIIDARLAKSEADFRAGRGYGPFDSADEMIAHLRKQLRKSAAAAKKKTVRSR